MFLFLVLCLLVFVCFSCFYVRYHIFRGLRCPSEPTTKLIASWWLLCSNSDESLEQMDETTKRMMMAHVKSTLDTRRRFSADPLEWLDSLPAAPLQMLQEYPDTFRVAFGSSSQSSPIPCPIDMIKLLSFDQSYGCRGGARHVPAAVAGPRRVLARQPSEQGPAERMAGLFMGRMESIFSSIMNNNGANCGPGIGRGLSAFANSSDLGRRMPTIEFEQPGVGHMALPAPMLQVQAPPAYVEPGAAAPSAAPAAAPAAQLVGGEAAAELDASGELAGMLDMLTARENAKNCSKSRSRICQ